MTQESRCCCLPGALSRKGLLRTATEKGLAVAFVSLLAFAIAGLAAVGATGGSAVRGGSASCARGSKAAVVGGKHVCLRSGQRCAQRYQRLYWKHGFNCVKGRLGKVKAVPAPPPDPPEPPAPPPPPPPAPPQPGHYIGLTAQGHGFEFDVTADGSAAAQLHWVRIDEACTPSGSVTYELLFNQTTFPILDGRFRIRGGTRHDIGGGVTASTSTSFAASVNGARAEGSFQMKTTFTKQGADYLCDTGIVSWTATHTA